MKNEHDGFTFPDPDQLFSQFLDEHHNELDHDQRNELIETFRDLLRLTENENETENES